MLNVRFLLLLSNPANWQLNSNNVALHGFCFCNCVLFILNAISFHAVVCAILHSSSSPDETSNGVFVLAHIAVIFSILALFLWDT